MAEDHQFATTGVSILGIEMSEEFSESMLDLVMAHYGSKRPSILNLKKVINSHLIISGFRPGKASTASPHQIRQKLNKIWDKEPCVKKAMFDIWGEYHEELVSKCKQWLKNHSDEKLEVKVTEDDGSPETIAFTKDVAEKLRADFAEIATPDELEAAMFLAMDQVDFSGEDHESEKMGVDAKISWEGILIQIREIPIDDPRWEAVDAFIGNVKEISEQKRFSKQEATSIESLRLILEEKKDQLLARADYFEVQGVANWDAEQVPGADCEDAVLAIHDLSTLLDEYERVENLSKPSTRQERMIWDNDRRQAEENVIAGYKKVQANFQASAQTITVMQEANPDLVEEIVEAVSPSEGSEEIRTAEEGGSFSRLPEVQTEHLSPDGVNNEAMLNPFVDGLGLQSSIEVREEENAFEQEATFPAEHECIVDVSESNLSAAENDIEGVLGELAVEMTEENPLVATETKVSPEEHVEEIIETVSEAEANAALLERLKTNDLSAAFWLADGMEKMNWSLVVPAWIVAAQQLEFWSISKWPEQSREFLNSAHDFIRSRAGAEKNSGIGASVMALSAGIYFSLIDQESRWEDLLSNPFPAHESQAISSLIDAVLEADRKGIHLDSLMVQMIVNEDSVNQYIIDQAQKARQWLVQSASRNARFFRAQRVWSEFIRPGKGELYLLIEKVASDKRADMNQISDQLENWRNRVWVDKHIQNVDKDQAGKNRQPIVGEARDQLIGWVEDIVSLAEEWCRAVMNYENVGQGREWFFKQVHSLCSSLTTLIIDARQNANELINSTEDKLVKISLEHFEKTLIALGHVISPKDFSSDAIALPAESRFIDEITIINNLAIRLHKFPEIELDDDGIPESENVSHSVDIITRLQDHSIEEALQLWIEIHDYRFVDALLDSMPVSDDREKRNREKWEARFQESLQSDINRFNQNEVEITVIAVEQALLEGLIPETEYDNYRYQIESIKQHLRQSDTCELRNFSLKKHALRLASIRATLDTKRLEYSATQRNDWNQIKEGIYRITGNDPTLTKKIENVVEKSISEGNTRAVGEYLAHLDDALSAGKSFEESFFETKAENKNTDIVIFLNLLPNYISFVEPRAMGFSKVRDAFVKNEPPPQIPMDNLPKERRGEIARGFDAWQRLKSSGRNENRENLSLIAEIKNFLGFSLIGAHPVSIQSSAGDSTSFRHWRVSASDNKFSPVAQFGSLRNQHYDVIGIWDRPGIEAINNQIASLMQQTGNQPLIVLYFHHFTQARRDSLLMTCHKAGLPMLVIDETVLFHLARERENRLKAMFNTTLPYSSINPYFPFAAGQIPYEVFKGRTKEVRQLIDSMGPAIVYGGRQLGKSALLWQVQREFHRPENGQFVIFEDIRLIGSPTTGKPYKAEFRDRIAQALVNIKLLEPQRASLDLDKLLNHIEQQIQEKKIRILLLLDEADHFLDADAETNFSIVTKLKALMDKTDRRFKIVLAGLHNVQRFGRIANQPLAHLGTPIEIGPMEPEAARDLLMDPLHALGYIFGTDPKKEDTSIVLHILSYTNYHPGLIQLFGHHLVEHLQVKRQKNAAIPFPITRSDIEAVYRKKEVREAIRERFSLTLALDPRYEAITMALILEQADDRNGFDRPYTSSKLRGLSENWWPQAFANEKTPDWFTSFLEEMRGLGVLSYNQHEKTYRLRSPNLVHLLGTQEEIFERMGILSESTPPEEGALESTHAGLDSGEFSPLTFAQERSLNSPNSGVAMIFGSNALGFGSLGEGLKRLLPQKNGAWNEIRIAARNAGALQKQIKQFLRENQNASILIAYRESEGDAENIAEEVQTAVQFCNQRSKNILRVCFALDSQATWNWLQMPKDKREALEESVDVVLSLKRWDKLGIKQRLEIIGEAIPESLLKKVHELTGGWQRILDEFLESFGGSDVSKAIESYRARFKDLDSPPVNSFISALGIYDNLPRKIISALKDPEVSQPLQEEFSSYSDAISWLSMSRHLEGNPPEAIEIGIKYLKILGILANTDKLELDPLVSRLWHES